MRELAAAGLAIGECGAAPLAALRALAADPALRRRCATRSASARDAGRAHRHRGPDRPRRLRARPGRLSGVGRVRSWPANW